MMRKGVWWSQIVCVLVFLNTEEVGSSREKPVRSLEGHVVSDHGAEEHTFRLLYVLIPFPSP